MNIVNCSICLEEITNANPGIGHCALAKNVEDFTSVHKLHYHCLYQFAKLQLLNNKQVECPECRDRLQNFGAFGGVVPEVLPQNNARIKQIISKILGNLFADAAGKGYLSVVKKFLENEAINTDGQDSSLIKAASEGHTEIFQEIWAKQAVSQIGIQIAVEGAYDNPEIIKFFIENAYDRIGDEMYNIVSHVINKCIISNNVEIIKTIVLILNDKNLGSGINFGANIQKALYHDKEEYAEKLLGLKLTIIDDYSFWSCMRTAVEKGFIGVIKGLLKKNPNISDTLRAKLIQKAQQKGREDIAALLSDKSSQNS